MEIRERERDPRHPSAGGAGADTGAGLDAARVSAEALLAAADGAIDRALSADSSAFLSATRQRGGQ